MRRRLLSVCALVVLALSGALVWAQSTPNDVYLPMVLNIEPSPTLTPLPLPTPTSTTQPTATAPAPPTATVPPPTPTQSLSGTCAQNAPGLVDGGEAWVTVPNPSQNSDETVCAYMSVNGVPKTNMPVLIIVHLSTNSYYTGLTDSQGIAAITFGVGDAPVGSPVSIDVWFGNTSYATTTFTPQ